MADVLNGENLLVANDIAKVYVAPLLTTAPTDATTAFGTGWADLGILGEDGLTEAIDEDRQEFRPMGYKSPLRTDINSVTKTMQFVVWSTNVHALSLYDRVAVADMEAMAGGGVHYSVYRPQKGDVRMFAFDILDSTTAEHIRLISPKGEVTERGEISYKGDEAIGYDLTVTFYESANGLLFDRYITGIDLPA